MMKRTKTNRAVILFVVWLGSMICFTRDSYSWTYYRPDIPEQNMDRRLSQAVAPLKYQTHLIDMLDLKEIEVADSLKLIAQKSGLNVIASPNVKGRITVYLKNIDALEALKLITDSHGWAYVLEDSIVKIMTSQEYEARYGQKFGKEELQTEMVQLSHVGVADILKLLNEVKNQEGKIVGDEKSRTLILVDSADKINEMKDIIGKVDIDVKTEVFSLNYATAEEVSTKVSEMLTPNVGMMKFDIRSNKVIVSDTEQSLRNIKAILREFDQKHKEVQIEAKIVQIILNDEHKMGVDWQALFKEYHNWSFKSNFNLLETSDKRGQVNIGTLETDDYQFLIEALKSVGTTNILSNPSITTINNQEAKILVGSTEPYVTSTTTTPSSGPTTTAETVNFIEVGVKLFVTPTISNDGFITMKIKPEVSSVVDNLRTSNNNTIPIVDTSEAEATVMVKDGVTIIIGGLIKEESLDSVQEVPVLSDFPIFGRLFSNKSSRTRKTEIVIFLTPRIVTGDIASQEFRQFL